MKASVIPALVLTAALMGAVVARAQTGPYESPAKLAPTGEIDRLVFARLKELDIQPANLCSDAVFVRRAYLDVIGTLPSRREASSSSWTATRTSARALIDRLLERDEFADYWAMKWSDLLRVKAEFPINLWPNAAQAYHRWIRTAIKDNHALRPVRARTAHGQRQQFPRARRSTSTAPCKTGTRQASPRPSR